MKDDKIYNETEEWIGNVSYQFGKVDEEIVDLQRIFTELEDDGDEERLFLDKVILKKMKSCLGDYTRIYWKFVGYLEDLRVMAEEMNK